MRDLGIEFISVFGLPPVEFVHLAADLGCRYISTSLTGARLESLGYAAFSLRDDARLRQDLRSAMDDRGVSISLGEGMVIAPGNDVSSLAGDLDIMAEIGAAQINTLSFDRDRNRFEELLHQAQRLYPSYVYPYSAFYTLMGKVFGVRTAERMRSFISLRSSWYPVGS